MEAGGHDADHDVRRPVHEHLAAQHACFSAKARLPEAVTEHDGGRCVRRIGLGTEDTSERGAHAQDPEYLAGQPPAFHALGLSVAGEVVGLPAEGSHLLEGAAHALPVAVVGRRELRVPVAALVLPEPHQPVRLREGQRPEEHVVGDREGGGRGANAQGGHRDRGERESPRAPQGARDEGEVLAQDVAVDAHRVDGDVLERGQPQPERGEEAGRVTAPPGKDGAHLFAVLGTEGSGIEAQEGAIQSHHAFPGAKPLARASRTSWVSRRASARATAAPKVVSR